MLSALRKTLSRFWMANHTKKRAESPLFSGSAYFSKHVPKVLTEKWVAHGGEISSGTTLDTQARYFFAMDPSDPWAMRLFGNSVVVIHAGWIVHCIEEAFMVPIAEYILDDKFIPGHPYKLNTNASGIYTPLSERKTHIGIETGEHGPISVQTSDTPSTPTSVPRKRRREQAYFDSPSGSFVFSAFDKDGLPRRPRKLRKLRFDPSFSPEGKPGGETMQMPVRDRFGDHQYSQPQHTNACLLSTAHVTTVQMPDTPDKPLARKELMAPQQYFHTCEHLQDPTRLSPPATSVDIQEKIPIAPIRTIDFTNLPPSIGRRFPVAARATKSRDTGTLLSITRVTENEVKTPKRISFADRAQVRVYPVSPQRLDNLAFSPAQQPLKANVETRTSREKVGSYNGRNPCSLEMNDEYPTQRLGGDQLENDTLMLTMEDIQAIRCRLLESAKANGADNGQLATMFELGKSFRGMAFRHVW